MPRFDKTKRYVLSNGKKFGKGVWYKDDGTMMKPGYGVYNEKGKTVIQYNSDGTISRYSREKYAEKVQKDLERRVLQNDRKYAIPFEQDKRMVITIDPESPTSRNKGAVISENLLDSIAVNAKRAGLPFKKAIGLVSQESTFGNGKDRGVGRGLLPMLRLTDSDPKAKALASEISYRGVQSPTLLISDWKQWQEHASAPFAEYIYDGGTRLRKSPQSESYYEENFGPSVNLNNRLKFNRISPLEHGFRKYKEHPEKWNPHDQNFQNKVEGAGEELVKYSPEIRRYMKKNNIHDDGGSLQGDSLDRLRLWDRLSLSEKSEIMRKAVEGGIYSLKDIRSAYNRYAEGGSLEDGEPVEGGGLPDYHVPLARTYADGGRLFKDGGAKDGDNASYAMDYFMRKGLSKEAAAGLVGNLMRESGLNPEALNKNGGAYGIAQWLGPRKRRLFDTYGSRPTLDQQLEFVWNELNSTHKKGLEMLKTSKTVDEAARNALGYYEFSAGPDAAIAALNKSGTNTKWKNPPGQKVMMQGIDNAWKAYGGVPDAPVYIAGQNPVPQFQLLPRGNDVTLFQPYPEPVGLEEKKDDTPAFMKKRDEEFDPFALLMAMNSEEERPVQETAAVKTIPMFTMPMRTFGEGGGVTDGSDTDGTYYAGTLPDVVIEAPANKWADNVVYRDPFTKEWKGIGVGGKTVTYGGGFDPSASRVVTSPMEFEQAKLARAKKDDLNHYGSFGNKVMDGVEILVTAPVPMEGINYLMSKSFDKVGKLVNKALKKQKIKEYSE